MPGCIASSGSVKARTTLMVRHGREALQEALVARTWELAEFLEEIDHVELTAHSSATVPCTATHVWRARANVPDILAPHVDADHLSWTAIVEWGEQPFASRWQILPHALRESVSCVADVNLLPALGGSATRMTIDVELRGLDGRRGIESVAQRLVQMNWQKLVEAASRKVSRISAPET